VTTPPTGPAARHAGDTEFLGLTGDPGSGRFRFTVTPHLARLDGKLYGGTAIAVSIAAAEAVCDRDALWMTTQYVSTATLGRPVDVLTEVLAAGRRTQQVRVTGTDEAGEVVFASLGATGRHVEGGLTGEFESRPTVVAPDESEHWESPFTGMARAAGLESVLPAMPRDIGFTTVLELRHAEVTHHPDPGPGRTCIWVRRRDRQPITPAVAAFLADMVPMSVARAFAVIAGGTSLDNTIRIGSFPDSEWVLIDLRPHLAVGDYAHGVAHVWSSDGHLMATASQTAVMRAFDPAAAPWAPATPSS
jgi:acyl-CoA thioesterase